MCIDYRMLNKNMIGDAYPLPLLLGKSSVSCPFPVLLVPFIRNMGTLKHALNEKSKPLTAFVSPTGSLEFNVICVRGLEFAQ